MNNDTPDVRLAIAIPAYGRSESSVLNYTDFLDEARALGVDIYVSDDSPDDEIRRLFESRTRRYGNLHYRRNAVRLGHDQNVVSSLFRPTATFTWVLGDSFRTKPGALEQILVRLEDQDFYFVNWNSRDLRMLANVDGDEARALIADRVWHQTLTGATIYHDRVRAWAQLENLDFHPNFPHLDVILGYASRDHVSVAWHGDKAMLYLPKSASYWKLRALDVFVTDWAEVLASHPSAIPPEHLEETIASHSRNTRLFSIEFLAMLRAEGRLTRVALRRPHFWAAMHLPRPVVLSLLLVPVAVMSRLVRTAKFLRRSARRLLRGGKVVRTQ